MSITGLINAGPSKWESLEIARGAVEGLSHINKFGLNPDLDSGTEDIWDGGSTWAEPTVARIHAVVSSSASDGSVGTGVRSIQIEGVDSSGDQVTEVIAMAGVTPVNTVNSYLMIHRMYAIEWGTGLVAAGIIKATAATDATITAQINLGNNQTHMSMFRIPTGFTGYICAPHLSLLGTTAAGVEAKLQFKETGGGWRTIDTFAVRAAGSSVSDPNPCVPYVIPADHFVKARGTSDSANAVVGFSYTLILIRGQ